MVSTESGVAHETSITGSLAWNLAGEALPALAAAASIPILVHRLGPQRFGALTLAWIVAGYFGLFDFGLGRALTKMMAEEFARARSERAAAIFSTAFTLMLG